jgi:hypothetical protein
MGPLGPPTTSLATTIITMGPLGPPTTSLATLHLFLEEKYISEFR